MLHHAGQLAQRTTNQAVSAPCILTFTRVNHALMFVQQEISCRTASSTHYQPSCASLMYLKLTCTMCTLCSHVCPTGNISSHALWLETQAVREGTVCVVCAGCKKNMHLSCLMKTCRKYVFWCCTMEMVSWLIMHGQSLCGQSHQV